MARLSVAPAVERLLPVLAAWDWKPAELSPEQLAMRASGIGGSEISSVVGLNPWGRRFGVFARKRPDLARDYHTEKNQIQKTVGSQFEPLIAKLGAEQLEAGEIMKFTSTLRLEGSICFATPDYIITKTGELIEIKSVGHRVADHWENGPPDYVLAQVQFQMRIAGAAVTWVIAFIGGRDLEVYRVDFDPDFAEGLIVRAESFWADHVEPGIAPPIDDSDQCRDWLAARFPDSSGEILEATAEANQIAENLRAELQAAKSAELAIDHLKNAARQIIGPAGGVETAAGKITWKRNKDSSRTDYKAAWIELRNLIATGENVADNSEAHRLIMAEVDRILEKNTKTTPGARVLRTPRSWLKGIK